jgi:hypothetical protein
MSQNLPAVVPSLARAFEEERDNLRMAISGQDLSSAVAVTEARRALDRTGDLFSRQTEDMQIQKAGLWLLEMVKSGAAVLDRGAKADIVWREVPRTSTRIIAGSTLFYGTAAFFWVAGFVQESRLTMLAAIALAALRFFDPKDWKHILDKIPFIGRKKQNLLEAPTGQNFLADAHISVEAGGYVDSLADALRTADHVLMRLAEPVAQTGWKDDQRLMAFVQGLLEARAADDAGFAMKLVGSELETILRTDGIEIVDYSKKTQSLFDVLPALDMQGTKPKQAAPALIADGEVLRRGTIWVAGK